MKHKKLLTLLMGLSLFSTSILAGTAKYNYDLDIGELGKGTTEIAKDDDEETAYITIDHLTEDQTVWFNVKESLYDKSATYPDDFNTTGRKTLEYRSGKAVAGDYYYLNGEADDSNTRSLLVWGKWTP